MNEDLERVKRLKWLARGNAPLSVWQHEMTEAADTIERLTREVDALQLWKDSAKAAEATWDLQEVGNLIIIPPGVPIRPAIQPAIERLTAELRLLQDTATLVEANLKAAEAEAARLRECLKSIAVKAGTSECGGDYVRAVSLIGGLEQMADEALRGEGKCGSPTEKYSVTEYTGGMNDLNVSSPAAIERLVAKVAAFNDGWEDKE